MHLIPHEINSQNNFIMGWYSEDNSYVNEILQLWNDDKTKKSGGFNQNTEYLVNNDTKESVDCIISVEQLYKTHYKSILDKCAVLYNQKYKFCSTDGFSLQEPCIIQHYPIGGGYKVWHHERSPNHILDLKRHLVFMTYLNDVEDGGTEFYYQNTKLKCTKGLTLIWPADWTHTHKGEISQTAEKYIITGWFTLGLKE
jgi:hypothetical protein